MSLEIINGSVYVEGIITTDPLLIGYVILDLAEEHKDKNHLKIAETKKIYTDGQI